MGYVHGDVRVDTLQLIDSSTIVIDHGPHRMLLVLVQVLQPLRDGAAGHRRALTDINELLSDGIEPLVNYAVDACLVRGLEEDTPTGQHAGLCEDRRLQKVIIERKENTIHVNI